MWVPIGCVASLVAQRVKRLPAMQETWVQSLSQEDLLEKEMATHSSTLAWKIPWTEKPGRLQSMGSQRVGTRLSYFTSLHRLCSPPGSSVHGILQARILEWAAISSSRGSSWPRDQTHIFCASCIAADCSTEPPGKLPLSVCVCISLFSRGIRFLWASDHIFINSLICNLVLHASVLKTPYLLHLVDNKQ